MTTAVMTRDKRLVHDNSVGVKAPIADDIDIGDVHTNIQPGDPAAIFAAPEGKRFLKKKLNESWAESQRPGFKWYTMAETKSFMEARIAEAHKAFGLD